MKRIGIIDRYISEWHANNYPAWIAEMNDALKTDYAVQYAWAEEDVSPLDGVSTDEWCRKMNVTRCTSIEELCEKSDALMILAPSDPAKHLEYAAKALPFGKPTFIDKTFAVSASEAETIFAIAEKHHAPMFSSSALRFATEVKELPPVQILTVTGGGSDFEEYLIHLVEMIGATLGGEVEKARVSRKGKQRICDLVMADGKLCTVLYSEGMPYILNGETADGKNVGGRVKSDFFKNLIRAILCFFADGAPAVCKQDTLYVMRVRDLLIAADHMPGQWITVNKENGS